MFAIAFICGMFAVLVFFASPSVDYVHLQADLLGARIAYDGGFSSSPGVINEEMFLSVDQEAQNPFPSSTAYWIAGRARVLNTETGDALIDREILYNRAAYDILSGQRTLLSAEPLLWTFPVQVERQSGNIEVGILEIEVLYAAR